MILRNLLTGLLLALLFIGCGDNNSDVPQSSSSTNNPDVSDNDNTVDINGTVNIVLMDGTSVVLTENSQQVSVNVRVLNKDNSPYSEGNVTVAYPDKVQNNVDVGTFERSIVSVGAEGRAIFNYTAPKNLQARVDAGDTSTVFGFYHDSDLTSMKYVTFEYEPIENQKVLTNYFLKESSSSSKYTMNLEDVRQLSYSVESSEGTKLSDDDINSMKITIKNPSLVALHDSLGNTGTSLTFTKRNNVSVSLTSNTKSGVVPIEVDATFVDVNGEIQNIVEVFNVTVFSGPPTAMSISYEGTSHDEEHAKFQENMIITVTDKYFNPINTQPAVGAYMIAGYALENASDPSSRLFIKTTDSKAGTMNPATNSLTSTADFSNVDLNNEFLLTYGNGYTYNVSGKWDIASKTTNSLVLTDTMEVDSSVDEIGFIVGNNYRQDVCRDGREWVGFVELESDRLDTNGMLRATINYDYYLTGKTIALGVEIIGYTAETGTTSKFGEVIKHTLRSTGFKAVSCNVPSGATNYTCRIGIEIDETAEWYRNANVGYDVITSDNISIVSVTNSNGQIFDCSQTEGIVYVDVTVNENEGKTGTISLDGILTASEF